MRIEAEEAICRIGTCPATPLENAPRHSNFEVIRGFFVPFYWS